MIKPIWHFRVMSSNRGDMGIGKAIHDAIHRRFDIPIANFSVRHDELDEQRIDQLNSEASLLMIGGSGLYTNYNLSSGWYFSCNPDLFDKIKVPIVLISIGSNNNWDMDLYGELTTEAKHSIRRLNDLAVLSSVRDHRTFDILRSIGVSKHELVADPACFLRYKPQAKEGLVGINIAQHIPMLGRFNREGNYRRSSIDNFRKICEYLRSLGLRLVFITHDCLEHSLVEELVSYFYIEYINTDDIDEMLKVYSKCKLTIGVRAHSNLFSFATGTPAIATYYDIKGIEFMRMLGNDFGVAVTTRDFYKDVIRFVDTIMKNYDEVVNNMKEKRRGLLIDFDRFIDKVCNVLKI